MPELPALRRDRFEQQYQLSAYDADVLTARKDLADYFEAGVRAGAPAKDMANWVMTDILRLVREAHLDDALVIQEWPVRAEQLAKLLVLVARGTINRQTAKSMLPKLQGSTADPEALVMAEGLGQVSDRGALEATVRTVLAAAPSQVEQFRAGNEKILGFLMGQVMKASGGKANPQLVQELLRAALTS